MEDYKRLQPFSTGLFTGLVESNADAQPSKYKKYYPTNMHGLVELISPVVKGSVRVRFLDTGVEREVSIHNLKKGKCKDPTREKVRRKMTEFEDKVYVSKMSGEYIILNRLGKDCTVKFLNTGTVVKCLIGNATKGKVRDAFAPVVYGVGYLGDFDCDASIVYKYEYTLWHNMLKRIYCVADRKGYYGKGVTVDERWLCFRNFLEDVVSLRNYDLWRKGVTGESTVKFNLDKDFAYLNCLHYSKETCQFINESLNKGTTSNTILRASRIDNYKRSNLD
jgi:hypothetical protein